MSSGLLPNSSTTTTLLRKQSNPNPNPNLGHFLTSKKIQFRNSKTPKHPSLHCFRTRAAAAVEEEEGGDLFGTKSGNSFYDLLGISEKGSFDEIKKAYKQMARKYHPDVSPPDRTEEYTRRFIVLHEAYETLCDPSKRAVYDRNLSRGLQFVFNSRKGFDFDEEVEEKSRWNNHRWEYQVFELNKRSMNDEENLSWGARMRRQKADSFA